MEEEKEKYKCPLCHISHSYSNNKHNIINYNDDKLLCSSCINKLLSKDNDIVISHDFIDYKNINQIKNEDIKHQSINESIIEEIRQQSKNKILVEEKKQQVNNRASFNEIPQNKSQNIQHNNQQNIQNAQYNNYYVKKSVKVNKTPKNNGKKLDYDIYKNLCKVHSLPLNIICIDEKQQICSHCVLNNDHLNHKVIIEKDFIEYIKELKKIYTYIESNQNQIVCINFSQEKFNIIEDINNIFLETEKNLTLLKNKIINNINNQFNTILNFMNCRRKEIIEKYQYSNYDIENLINTSQSWIKSVSDILNESNIKNNNYKNINILQMLNNNEDKNIFNLINKGKQLNERFNFMKEIYQIIDKLEIYKKEGITIKQNEEIINSISDSNTSKIIYIEENQNLIKELGLEPFNNLNKKTNPITKELNININTNNEEINIDQKKNKTKNKNKVIKNRNVVYAESIDKNNNYNQDHEEKIYFRKIPDETGKYNFTEIDFNKIKIIKSSNSNSNSKRNTVSSKKSKNFFQFTEEDKSNLPNLNNIIVINKKDKKINKLLRNKTAGNMNSNVNEKKNTNKYRKKNESIELSNYNDNNKININFNGHIFNYNSDSNFSFNIPEISNNNNNINTNSNTKQNKASNDIFKLLTPKKNEKRIKKIEGAEKQKIIRCFSFNAETNKNRNSKKIKKNPSNLITRKNSQSLNNTNNTNNNILYTGTSTLSGKNFNNFKKDEQTFRNFDFFGKKEKKRKNNYKTLNKKELEKYINYQMKKIKINFNRINLKETGIKIMCSFFNKNKSKKYKEIKLQGCNLTDVDFELFCKSLFENNIIIPIINLSENNLSDDSTFIISDFIGKYKGIKKLLLSNNLFSKGIKGKIKEIMKFRNNQDNNDIIIQI